MLVGIEKGGVFLASAGGESPLVRLSVTGDGGEVFIGDRRFMLEPDTLVFTHNAGRFLGVFDPNRLLRLDSRRLLSLGDPPGLIPGHDFRGVMLRSAREGSDREAVALIAKIESPLAIVTTIGKEKRIRVYSLSEGKVICAWDSTLTSWAARNAPLERL